ncbi:MAG: alpha/beta family hydrolase [Candidatus Eisenbacteria bacterium]
MSVKAKAARRGSMAAQYTRGPRPLRRPARLRVAPGLSVRAMLTVPFPGVARPVRAAIVLAHGAGGTMAQPLVVALADALAARGALVLRFNFAYADVGRRAPDRAPLLAAAYRAAIAWLCARPEARGRALVLGGKSLGGRVASGLAALGDPCDGVLLFGYPLHPAGQPEKLRDAHLAEVPCPMLFLEGTRDPLCDLALLRPVLRRLGRRAKLVVIEGGDHSFAVPKALGRSAQQIVAELAEESARWIARLKLRRSPAASSARRRGGTTKRGSRSAPGR